MCETQPALRVILLILSVKLGALPTATVPAPSAVNVCGRADTGIVVVERVVQLPPLAMAGADTAVTGSNVRPRAMASLLIILGSSSGWCDWVDRSLYGRR